MSQLEKHVPVRQWFVYLMKWFPHRKVTLCIITFILSLVGNLTVIIVSRKSRHVGSDLKVYLMSLAAADILMAVFCLPFQVPSMIVRRWLFGNVMCPLVKYAQQVTIMVSIYTLLAVSIDRYRAVVNPLHRMSSTSNNWFIVSCVWIASLITCSGQLVLYRCIEYPIDFQISSKCVIALNEQQRVIYRFIFFAVLFILPFIILLVTYGRITYKVVNHRQPGIQITGRQRSSMRNKKKVLVNITKLFK
ncbi:RYamide receptor-like [Glandiceps talaboti]